MVRYLVAASAAFALLAGAAVAEPMGPTTKTVIRTDHGKIVKKSFVNHRGMLVTKRKIVRDGFAGGSTVTRSRTVTDPVTGVKRTESRTEMR